MTEKLQNPFEIGELITAVNSTIDDVNEKQDTLVSGTNIKTINNESILGSGNITIEGGDEAVWGNITGTLSDQTDLQTALNAKAADNAVVKLTGNETITGTKTFWNNVTYLTQTNDNTGLEIQSNNMSYVRLHIPNSTFVSIGCRVNEEILYVTSGDFTRFAPIYAGYNTHNNCCMLNYNFQVVSALPAYPDGNVYYFIPE